MKKVAAVLVLFIIVSLVTMSVADETDIEIENIIHSIIPDSSMWGMTADSLKKTNEADYKQCKVDEDEGLYVVGINVGSYDMDAYYVFDEIGLSKIAYILHDGNALTKSELDQCYQTLVGEMTDLIGNPVKSKNSTTLWTTESSKIELGKGKLKKYTGSDASTVAIIFKRKESQNRPIDKSSSANEYSSKVESIPVGNETKNLSFEVIDKGLEYWVNSIGSKEVFAFIAIKNTDNRYIYLDNCKFDYEDNAGHIIDTAPMVSKCPDVIAPNEVGYFYVAGINGGNLADSANISKGIKLIAQFSLKESHEAIYPYEVLDDKLEYENTLGTTSPVIRGRVKNGTDKDENLLYINVIYIDKAGNIIAIDGTTILNLYAGSTVGFEISSMFLDMPRLKKGNIGSYDIIASPTYYQYW